MQEEGKEEKEDEWGIQCMGGEEKHGGEEKQARRPYSHQFIGNTLDGNDRSTATRRKKTARIFQPTAPRAPPENAEGNAEWAYSRLGA